MTDREALLRGVAANPDEDTPRLAYADLLDELGGEADAARARFIRLQIETHHGPGDTGGTWTFERKTEEAAALAVRFAREWNDLPSWAKPLHGLLGTGPADFYARGFVERVRVKPKSFALCGDELFATTPVRTLEVQAGSPRLIPAVFGRPVLGGLKVLSVRWRGVADDLVTVLAGSVWLRDLHELDLSGCQLTERAARILARSERLSGLRVLRLRGEFVNTGVAHTLAGSDKLISLHEIDLRESGLWPHSLDELRERFPNKWFRS